MRSNNFWRTSALAGVVTIGALLAPGVAQAAPIDHVGLEASDALVSTGSTSSGVAVRLTNSGDADVLLSNVKVVIDNLCCVLTEGKVSQNAGARLDDGVC